MATKPGVPRSGAVSNGYNFASHWEQNVPLTEQQQAAIASLSHAVAERPLPPNLVQDRNRRSRMACQSPPRTAPSAPNTLLLWKLFSSTRISFINGSMTSNQR